MCCSLLRISGPVGLCAGLLWLVLGCVPGHTAVGCAGVGTQYVSRWVGGKGYLCVTEGLVSEGGFVSCATLVWTCCVVVLLLSRSWGNTGRQQPYTG